MEAVHDSFHKKLINLKEKRKKKSSLSSMCVRPLPSFRIDLKEKRRKNSYLSSMWVRPLPAQKKGTLIHKKLAEEINTGTKEGTAGKMLKAIEDCFDCKFLKAEVPISGYAARKFKVDYYSGSMDAVAIRQRPKGVLEVFVVDWKTTSKNDVADLSDWWNKATNFKIPLYQCLIYRELLQMHLMLNKIKAEVGIMLVPFHQSDPELLMPGLCMDDWEMENEGLLYGLKKFEWYPEEHCGSGSESGDESESEQKHLSSGIESGSESEQEHWGRRKREKEWRRKREQKHFVSGSESDSGQEHCGRRKREQKHFVSGSESESEQEHWGRRKRVQKHWERKSESMSLDERESEQEHWGRGDESERDGDLLSYIKR